MFGDTQDVDLSSDGSRLVIGGRFGWVVQMATDFTDVSYFQAGDDPVFAGLQPAAAPTVVPTVSVGDATVTEGDTARLPDVHRHPLSEPTTATVTVGYAVQAGTATAGEDYSDTSGSVTFFPGQTTKSLTVGRDPGT